MKSDFKRKKRLAITALVIFLAVLYAGFRYWHYTNAYGRTVTFTGKVTFNTADSSICKFFEIDKDTVVRVSCDKDQLDLSNKANKQYRSDNGISPYGNALKTSPFEGVYDKNIAEGDTVEVKAVRINPNGSTKYKFYEIRANGTYVKKK